MSPFVLRGLRLLPWLLLARRRSPDAVSLLFDCDRCKKTQPADMRQYMGCGYLPSPDSRVPVVPWDHVGRDRQPDETDDAGRVRLPVCPGYACGLPEVVEVSWAYTYWDKGELTQFCDGQSTATLRNAIAVYAIERARADEWDGKNQVKP